MEKEQKEQKEKAKAPRKKDKFVDNAIKRYNELLQMQIDFNQEFKPLKQYLIKMGKLPKEEKKKK